MQPFFYYSNSASSNRSPPLRNHRNLPFTHNNLITPTTFCLVKRLIGPIKDTVDARITTLHPGTAKTGGQFNGSRFGNNLSLLQRFSYPIADFKCLSIINTRKY